MNQTKPQGWKALREQQHKLNKEAIKRERLLLKPKKK
jgi:hypothetical protein